MRDLKVLLVEDNDADIILTCAVLADAGLDKNLALARDGEEAISYISKKKQFEKKDTPDLIFLDINLPRMSGKEVLGFIKNNQEYASIPVIMFTSSDLEKDVFDCYDNGADLYLNKSHSMSSFYNVVKTIREFTEKHFLN